MIVLLKMDSPAVIILHLLVLYASQDDVRSSELVNIKVSEVAILNGYLHFTCQPSIQIVPLLSGFWFPFPKAIKDNVAHLLSCPHWLVSQQTQGFPWAGLMRPHIGPACFAEVAVSAPVLPAIDTGIRAVGYTPSADITPGRMGIYHGQPPFAGLGCKNHSQALQIHEFCISHLAVWDHQA